MSKTIYKMADVHNCRAMRVGMLVPAVLLVASVVAGCLSYAKAKIAIARELNEAVLALANENGEKWIRQDTVAALRTLNETTRQPLVFSGSDMAFRNATLKQAAYYTLALVDNNTAVSPRIQDDKIASDSILLMAGEKGASHAIRLQGFADCSVASVWAVSDQRFPALLFLLSVMSMVSMVIWIRKRGFSAELTPLTIPEGKMISPILDNIHLTPMQRRLMEMFAASPDMRVDKSRLCQELWGNKSNAEESLYTLVRRTKTAVAEAGYEIVCHRGDSYELRLTN